MTKRTAPCFCGSGKRFKFCHGKIENIIEPNAEMNCINCFRLGYFRTEKSRDGDTTSFLPETLPVLVREMIDAQDGTSCQSALMSLTARGLKIACLFEGINHKSQRQPFETAYDKLEIISNISSVKNTATATRRCQGFLKYDQNLSFGEFKLIGQKQQIDSIVLKINTSHKLENLALLTDEFENLEDDLGITPQQRGKRLETWLGKLFKTFDLDSTLDVINDHEQIDFTFWLGNLFVVGEARWLKDHVDTKQVRDFYGKLSDRPPFVVGLIIAINGFTETALGWISRKASEITILAFTKDDLDKLLSGSHDLEAYLMGKIRDRLEHP